MTMEKAIQMLRLYEVNEYGEGELKTWYNGIDKDMREALDMAIDALKADDEDEPQFYTEDDYWNGMFTESAEAYKAWTGEEMGRPHGRLIDADRLKEVFHKNVVSAEAFDVLIDNAPTIVTVHGWIPCSERLPEDLEAVNVTWVNHNPPVYYQYTKDVPNADTAVYYRGAWYWWDATVIDLLGEYGGAYSGVEPIDKDIEVTAWMPLPKPYKGGDTE